MKIIWCDFKNRSRNKFSSADCENRENIFHMKLLGNTNDDRNVARDQQPMQRSQDDATVGYVFQRSHIQHHEAEYVAQFAQKQQTRWASGDDHSLDVSVFSLFL